MSYTLKILVMTIRDTTARLRDNVSRQGQPDLSSAATKPWLRTLRPSKAIDIVQMKPANIFASKRFFAF